MATFDAVLSFNDGSIARSNILKSLGLKPGQNTVNLLKEVEHNRRYIADRAARQLTNEAKQARQQAQERKNDFDNDYQGRS